VVLAALTSQRHIGSCRGYPGDRHGAPGKMRVDGQGHAGGREGRTMAGEQDWVRDKSRFVRDAEVALRRQVAPTRDHGFPLGPLGQQFATLTYSLLDAETVDDVLDQVVRATVGVVPEAEIVSVTLRSPDGRFHTPVETGAVAYDLDQLQYELGEGPCLDAAIPGGPAVSFCDDLTTTASWPKFAAGAVELGVRAVLSTALIPAPVAPQQSGALNIYSRSPHGLDNVDWDVVLLLATHASLALAGTEAVTRAQLKEAHLAKAIDSRDVIGQAKGIIMARRGVQADEAFDLLRRASQELNVKLVELAETLTERHTELDLSADGL
jgi:hypothetical protein